MSTRVRELLHVCACVLLNVVLRVTQEVHEANGTPFAKWGDREAEELSRPHSQLMGP